MTTTAYKFDFINASGNADIYQCGGVVGKVDEAIKCLQLLRKYIRLIGIQINGKN